MDEVCATTRLPSRIQPLVSLDIRPSRRLPGALVVKLSASKDNPRHRDVNPLPPLAVVAKVLRTNQLLRRLQVIIFQINFQDKFFKYFAISWL